MRQPRTTSWTLTFEFAGGEKVTQGWNAEWKQSVTTITVKNTSWNGSLSTGTTVTAGFLGSRAGATGLPTGSAASS
ncbi:cellulose binding domain-containing protein [Streptomyces sp. T028]|uniref:cellulose binding domain-containing protein n=1 Tax=Streptomyces sp. T028 TaxID=3394379 RepID=UPI003A83D205